MEIRICGYAVLLLDWLSAKGSKEAAIVTLVCEDCNQTSKVILATASPLNHPHPLNFKYIETEKSQGMGKIFTFIYDLTVPKFVN